MTILSRMLETRASIESPLVPLSSQKILEYLPGGGSTKAGRLVNERSAVGRFIAVYRAVSIVSDAIGSLPLRAFRDNDTREPFLGSKLTYDPHPDFTPMELWSLLLAQDLLWGNCYGWKLRDATTAVTGIDPIPPRAVATRRVKRTADNPEGKEFTVSFDDGTRASYTSYDVFHSPGPGYDGVTGLSPIGVAREAIGMGLAAEEYGARVFGSGVTAGGFLQTDSVLDEGQADRLKKRVKERITGLDNAHDIAVLDSGAKYVSIGIPPQDAQYIEARKFQIIEIARLYGIPPHLLGDVERSTSWGTGIEQQNIGLIVYTLSPWMTRLEQRLSKLIPRPYRMEFDTSRLLRGDEKGRADAARIWVNSGIKTRTEARRAENLPPVAGTDRLMLPSGAVLLDEEGNPPPKPTANTPVPAVPAAEPVA